HALYALEGLTALDSAILTQALGDDDERVRQHAVRLSEKFCQFNSATETLVKGILALAKDPSAIVRYQVAFTLGEFRAPQKIKSLAEIARRDIGSTWTQAAILSSLADGAGQLFDNLASDEQFPNSKPGLDFLGQLVFL